MSLPRRFSLIHVRVKVWKLVYQQIVNQALLGEAKHQLILGACVSNVVKSTKKECLCYHELNAREYFKIKRLYVYLLAILQIFFIALINKKVARLFTRNSTIIINLFLIHNTKRQKVFSVYFLYYF